MNIYSKIKTVTRRVKLEKKIERIFRFMRKSTDRKKLSYLRNNQKYISISHSDDFQQLILHIP